MQTFKKLFFLLSIDERKQAGLLLVLIIIMALFDTIGVASIMPFMAVLTNPEIVETNFFLKLLFEKSYIFGVKNIDDFLFYLGGLIFILLIISLTFKTFTTYKQVHFAQMRQYTIGRRLIEGYLNQPYSWFLSRHSADIEKTILSEVSTVIGNGINPFIELIAKGIITIALITLLILANPKLSLIVGFSLAFLYGIIFYFIRRYLTLIGSKSLLNNQLRFTAVSEAIGAAKEIKVGGLEQKYIQNYSTSAKIYAKTLTASNIIAILPRFILEAIAFGGIILMLLYIISQTGSLNNALPIISLYVFAGYRLMPSLQVIYSSITKLTFVGPSLNRLYDDLKSLKPLTKNQENTSLAFDKMISLNNIFYNYPNSSKTAIEGISLSILAKSTIGFIGTTGSGKTTIIDIILGLLQPQKGTLEVDGKIISAQNIKSWQRCIGYVPQHIYLSDDTISANIAFGIDNENINQKMVEDASKIANLHDFVINDLSQKYHTTIGERGVRLSGGQRQRIGIARALYHNPKILVLDEATSALDYETEKAVMDAVNNIGKDITIILIAHRLGSVKICDKIFMLEKGKVKAQGSFEELINSNEDFRKSAML
jgi:ABC-type multidrug transport system fused ATPase/permease subunit